MSGWDFLSSSSSDRRMALMDGETSRFLPRPLGNVYSLLHSQFKHLFHWDRGVWSSASTKKPWLGLYISPSFRFSLGFARVSPVLGYIRPMKVSERIRVPSRDFLVFLVWLVMGRDLGRCEGLLFFNTRSCGPNTGQLDQADNLSSA